MFDDPLKIASSIIYLFLPLIKVLQCVSLNVSVIWEMCSSSEQQQRNNNNPWPVDKPHLNLFVL